MKGPGLSALYESDEIESIAHLIAAAPDLARRLEERERELGEARFILSLALGHFGNNVRSGGLYLRPARSRPEESETSSNPRDGGWVDGK